MIESIESSCECVKIEGLSERLLAGEVIAARVMVDLAGEANFVGELEVRVQIGVRKRDSVPAAATYGLRRRQSLPNPPTINSYTICQLG